MSDYESVTTLHPFKEIHHDLINTVFWPMIHLQSNPDNSLSDLHIITGSELLMAGKNDLKRPLLSRDAWHQFGCALRWVGRDLTRCHTYLVSRLQMNLIHPDCLLVDFDISTVFISSIHQ